MRTINENHFQNFFAIVLKILVKVVTNPQTFIEDVPDRSGMTMATISTEWPPTIGQVSAAIATAISAGCRPRWSYSIHDPARQKYESFI